ncbi:hypothetical protein ANME2D_01448 [Candidatus Methanoperedens nitroreducens]|uniref:Uncharacterized protein n=1 Tax=Candidatus Methanoperedens nitratireducens TaxID=1392998 RepID=A0A062V3Y6_9EURY|nr:hypothetical protein [Candidatus Methanoperedens nitroreducens]KCZ72047.1 hypothetical protein ANME2D_01448 [Candidatus Methanoperedens nitroreducens]MDJ1421977.1 hypothetical protein [Candidatus Methanoperedens sp.]
MILAIPVLADIDQKAKMTGDNVIEINIKQTAWNYGSGDVNQYIDVFASGNYQMVSQDSIILISDSDHSSNISNNMNGTNLVILNLDQYTKNMGSGNVAQGIEVTIEDNIQMLDQDVIVAIAGE